MEKNPTEKVKTPWNSLEVAKLGVSLLTGLSVGAIGLYFTLQFKFTEERRFREAIVSQLEEATSEYEGALSKMYFKLATSGKKIDRAEAEISLASLTDAERIYQQRIAKIRYRLERDVFSGDKDAIDVFWRSAEQSFGNAQRCLTRGLKAAELEGEVQPQKAMWDCYLAGREQSEYKLVGPSSGVRACARNLIEAASIASLTGTVRFERLKREVEARTPEFAECH